MYSLIAVEVIYARANANHFPLTNKEAIYNLGFPYLKKRFKPSESSIGCLQHQGGANTGSKKGKLGGAHCFLKLNLHEKLEVITISVQLFLNAMDALDK